MLRGAIRLELGDEGQLCEHHVVHARVLLHAGNVIEELAMTLGGLGLEQTFDDVGLVLC